MSGVFQLFCTAVVVLVFGSPIIRSRFLGDDLETWNFFVQGAYPNSVLDSLSFAGLDKWRPLNTLAMQAILRAFENSYRPYWFFSTSIIFAIVVISAVAVKTMFHSLSINRSWGGWFGLFAIGSSPFTFMARSSVYGFLELAPVAICIVSYLLFWNAGRSARRLLIIYSSLLALLAGLIHERFLVFSGAMAVLCLLRGKRNQRLSGFWLIYVSNLIFYVYSTSIVLQVNALRGGGEQPLNESGGWWIISRYFFALLRLIGGASAKTTYFDPSNPNDLYQQVNFSDEYNVYALAIVGFIAIAALFSVLLRITKSNSLQPKELSKDPESDRWNDKRTIAELAFISLCLLAPASTVISRIESRWLFAPFVFLVIALIGTAGQVNNISSRASQLVLLVFLLMNVLNRNSFSEFDWWRTRTEKVLNTVERHAPDSGYWELAIIIPKYPNENNSVIWWGLNYGNALTEYVDNGPNGIYVGETEVVRSCKRPCLVLNVFDDTAMPTEIDRAQNQQVTFRWLNK
jgi:hypothetical protein